MRPPAGRRRRMAFRTLSLAALAAAAGPIGGLVQSQQASALAPSTVAYWVKLGAAVPTVPKGGLLVANDPTSAASPTAPPPLPAPVAVPAPPPPPAGVPNLTGPTAVSTVKIDGVTQGADATLTLKVAPGSIPPPPSTTTMVACVIHGPWTPPPGGTGNIASAPAADCSSASTGKVAADNSTVSWLLPSSFQDNGTLNVELEPNPSGPPAPFVVSFAAPDTGALQLASGPPAAPPPPEAAPAPAAEVAAPATVPQDFSGLGVVPTYSVPAPAAPAPAAPARQQITLASPAAVHVPSVADDRGHRIMAVAGLFLLALAWWWVGSRPARAPRLLGALKSGTVEGRGAPAVRVGGIGRFARMHAGVPRRI